MAVSRRLAWLILLGTILTAGILRQFHERIPSSPFLPWPIRSLLFFLLVILFLVLLRGWGQRQEIPYAGPELTRVNFLAFLPLLIALTLEKWVSITFYAPLFYWLNGSEVSLETFNALYVVEASLGLMVVTLVLAPMFRRLLPMARRYLAPSGLPLAGAGILLALVCLFAGLALLIRLVGFEGARLRWTGFGPVTALILAGQALIALAEELYYRGLLQTELAFLLPSLGVSRERFRQLSAVVLVSIAFALEHLVFAGSLSEDLRRLAFTFGCSLFLGSLLVLTSNLWFNAGCHCVLNMFVLGTDPSYRGAGLQFVDQIGRPVFDPAIYIFLFFIFAFILTYLKIAVGSRFAQRTSSRDPATTG